MDVGIPGRGKGRPGIVERGGGGRDVTNRMHARPERAMKATPTFDMTLSGICMTLRGKSIVGYMADRGRMGAECPPLFSYYFQHIQKVVDRQTDAMLR